MKAKFNNMTMVAVAYGVLFLFFFQLLTDFVEAIYAFGLMGTSIPPEIVAVVLFFSPVILFLMRRCPSGNILRWLMVGVVLARLIEALLPTRGKMLLSGLGVATSLILFAGLFCEAGTRKRSNLSWNMAYGLVLAVGFSIFVRAWNSGVDMLTYGPGQWVAWLLAGIPVLVLWKEWHGINEPFREEQSSSLGTHPDRPGLVVLSSVGLFAVFMLLYFAFIAPSVIVRWTQTHYFVVVAFVAFATPVIGLGTLNYLRNGTSIAKGWLIAWNLVFILALVSTIYLHQIPFPADPATYPLFEPVPGPWRWLALGVLLLTFSVIFLDFFVFADQLTRSGASRKALGTGFTLGGVYMLLMVLAHVFTSVYDYIPVVGGYFRDRFWLVHLVAGLMLLLPTMSVRFRSEGRLPAWRGMLPVGIALAVFSVVGVWATQAKPQTTGIPGRTLKVLTYNIQQGYRDDGIRGYAEQLEVMRSVDADIIGLQESDTNRIANGNADLVRYFADRLNMHAYYGPKTVLGTFGIALLSRLPLQSARTFYMYSQGEQTATIEGVLVLDGMEFNIFVTHLGNGGPMIQQEQVLQVVNGKPRVILMGDFNFRPDTPQYAMTLETLRDAWLFLWPSGDDHSGIDPQRRIDHIFVSSDIQVLEASYLISIASDHPALYVTIGW